MLEVGLGFLEPVKYNLTSLQFKWIIFKFCGIVEATELGETV